MSLPRPHRAVWMPVIPKGRWPTIGADSSNDTLLRGSRSTRALGRSQRDKEGPIQIDVALGSCSCSRPVGHDPISRNRQDRRARILAKISVTSVGCRRTIMIFLLPQRTLQQPRSWRPPSKERDGLFGGPPHLRQVSHSCSRRPFRSAGCVIVVWSRTSVSSDWVKMEAPRSRRRILIPGLIEDVTIRWSSGAFKRQPWLLARISPHSGFDSLVAAVTSLVGSADTLSKSERSHEGAGPSRCSGPANKVFPGCRRHFRSE